MWAWQLLWLAEFFAACAASYSAMLTAILYHLIVPYLACLLQIVSSFRVLRFGVASTLTIWPRALPPVLHGASARRGGSGYISRDASRLLRKAVQGYLRHTRAVWMNPS